jgi:hypothetical protein
MDPWEQKESTGAPLSKPCLRIFDIVHKKRTLTSRPMMRIFYADFPPKFTQLHVGFHSHSPPRYTIVPAWEIDIASLTDM